MVIPTGINVNKNKRVEKMTEEEVKALIQELRDEIPEIHKQLHVDMDVTYGGDFHNETQKENAKKASHYKKYIAGGGIVPTKPKGLKDSK